MRSFLAALQFLTVIPIPARLETKDCERSTVWFPVVGLLIGAMTVGGDFLFTRAGFSGPLLGILTVGFMAVISGGLHLDGLADTADGFLSARPRERVLEIMRDSRIGTMGVLALIFVLALKVTALCELNGLTRWKTLLLAPLAGRVIPVIVMSVLTYARKQSGGLAAVFVHPRLKLFAVWSGLWLLAGSILLLGLRRGGLFLVLIMVVSTWLSLWSRRRIGGFTGDTLGATSEIVETSTLLFALVCRSPEEL